LLTFCGPSKESSGEEEPFTQNGNQVMVAEDAPVLTMLTITAVQQSTINRQFKTTGEVRPQASSYAEISTPFSGRITRSFVEYGQQVAANDPVFELSSAEYFQTQKEYIEKNEEYKLALSNFQRQQDLFENNVGSGQGLEEAETEYLSKKAALQQTEAALKIFSMHAEEMEMGKPLVIRTPISGEIIDHKIILGQYLKEDADPVAYVAKLDKVWITAHVKEKDLPFLHTISKVNVNSSVFPGTEIEGTILHIGQMLHPETRSVSVLIEVENQDKQFKPGMYVDLVFYNKEETGLLIPVASLLLEEDQPYVFVEAAKNTFEKRFVDVAEYTSEHSIVLSGINPEEKVVTANAIYLLDAF